MQEADMGESGAAPTPAELGRMNNDLRAWAAHKSGSLEPMRDLIASGADPMSCDGRGNTALMRAARNGRQEAMEFLLQRSDPKAVNTTGETALMHAVEGGAVDSVRLLLPVSDVGARDEHGRTALMLAATCPSAEVFDMVLAAVLSISQDRLGSLCELSEAAGAMAVSLKSKGPLQAEIMKKLKGTVAAIKQAAALESEVPGAPRSASRPGL